MVVHESDVNWTEVRDFRRKKLAAADGATDLGCSLYELPPGEGAWPYHYHEGNAEALFVLDGTGRLRTPDGERSIAAGHFAAFPASADGAHRVVNDGDDPLRYLVVSTMTTPDVTVYPDSDTFGVFTGSPPGGEGERPLHGYYPRSASVDYWRDVADGDRTDPAGRE